ncbi:MAG: TPD domain-containing protein [Thermoplasmata archaeon]|nr:MAG: TPD domain-containing protein [Thermoplasmata archaeon]
MTPVITPERYEELVEGLQRYSDIARLAGETGIEEEALLVIYTQKVTRDATRRYYRIKSRAGKYYHQWRSGKPLMKFARENRFPPILTALIILLEGDVTRKGFWRMVENPGRVPDARLRREIKEIVKGDPIYSPRGAEVQAERGRHGEERLQAWLDDHEVGYRDEEELRGTYPKTPDILLDEPLNYNGTKLYWIESKGNFGDRTEVSRNFKRQLLPYSELFGPGMVIYWFGVVDGLQGRRNDVFVGTPETLDELERSLARS